MKNRWFRVVALVAAVFVAADNISAGAIPVYASELDMEIQEADMEETDSKPVNEYELSGVEGAPTEELLELPQESGLFSAGETEIINRESKTEEESKEKDISEEELPEEESENDEEVLVSEDTDPENEMEAGNFCNLVVFIEFQDAALEGEEEELWELLDGEEEQSESLSQYLMTLSYGQLQLENRCYQYDEDKIVPYVLEGKREDYYNREDAVIEEVLRWLSVNEQTEFDTDRNEDGIVDNLMLVVPQDTKNEFDHCGSRYDGSENLNGCKIGNYMVISEADGLGTIAHAFFHTLGYPDLYIEDGQEGAGFPVGEWGLMAQKNSAVRYPLAYLRSQISDWFQVPVVEVSKEGYSLYSAADATDETKDQQAVILKTGYSDQEFFVIEYRRNETEGGVSDYDTSIPGSGLILYRVNTSCETNEDGSPWMIYVFRPNDDYGDQGIEKAQGDIAQAFLSTESGRVSYGKTGSDASLADGALTYSDGVNSGIVISGVGSADGAQITFDIEFAEEIAAETRPEEEIIEETFVTPEPAEKELTEETSVILEPAEKKLTEETLVTSESSENIKESGEPEEINVLERMIENSDLARQTEKALVNTRAFVRTIQGETVYQGVDYSAVYDYAYYLSRYSDLKVIYGNNSAGALQHFVTCGMKEGRQGSEEFNVYTYKNRYADLRRVFGSDLSRYYLHYISSGKKENRDAKGTSAVNNPVTVYEGKDYSTVYDYSYYVNQYADVKKAFGEDDAAVLRHFVVSGMREGRQGNAEFNVYTYKNRYADLRRVYGNDLPSYYLHYIICGKRENRSAKGTSGVCNPLCVYNGKDYSAVYEYSYYVNRYADIKKAFGEDDAAVLKHFVTCGMKEGRQGSSEFNVYTYKNRYADLRRAFGNDLPSYYLHYINSGKKENRNAKGTSAVSNPITVYEGKDYSAVYDYSYYINKYLDIKKAFGEDDAAVLRHFVLNGMAEGRQGNSAFNVFAYKERYADLKQSFGSDLKAYYLHYIQSGIREGRNGQGNTPQRNPITVYNGVNYAAIYDYDYYVNAYPDIKQAFGDNDYAVLEHFVTVGMAEGRIASPDFNVYVYKNDNPNLERLYGSDWKSYFTHYLNQIAEETGDPKDRYMGYYEGYQITSKKGIQGVSEAYTEDLRAQHVLLNVDLADMVSTTARAGFVPYEYKGKTYYFQDLIALRQTVYYLHGWGSDEGNPYGMNHTRAVTFNLLLSWKDELSYLIHPSARIKGAAPYYALNMQEENARSTFEALFCYMGEAFGEYKRRVSNWTLGNEVNSCNAWNYSGLMSLKDCAANYAQAFQLLYQGVERGAKSSRLFISLDHCWTAADAGYSGKAFLDEFAAYMNQTAPSMRWNVNFHPYSQPLSRADFWNDFSNTTNDVNTRYISMRNLDVLTDYLSVLETQYGKIPGSIRVILGEVGYSGRGGNEGEENCQAAALGYGYYKAMFNTRVDAYIIRAYLDDLAETSAGLWLGLRQGGSTQYAKKSYELYKNLDVSISCMDAYKGLAGVSSWESVIPGFNASQLIVNDF